MEGWFTHLHLFIYFTILYSVYKTSEDWTRMWSWFAIGSVAVAMQGLLQLFGQSEFFLSKYLINSSSTIPTIINSAYPTSMGNTLRLDSTLGNAAYFGIYTLFFVFIGTFMSYKMNKWSGPQGYARLLWVMLSSLIMLTYNFFLIAANAIADTNLTTAQNIATFGNFVWFIGLILLFISSLSFVRSVIDGKVGSITFAIVAFVNLILLAYTQTRGSYLGLMVGAVISMICIVSFGRKEYPKLAKSALLSIGIISMLIGIFIAFKDTNLVRQSVILNRLATINANPIVSPLESVRKIKDENVSYDALTEWFGEATIVSRLLNAKMSIDGVNDSTKTLLLGYGQENYHTVFASKFDPRMYAQEAWFDRAHNVFMDWLVAGGLLGLISYLALYLTPIYMMWRGKGRNNMKLIERSLLTGLLTAYFIHNVFVFDNLMSYIIFIALLAYIASITRSHDAIKVEAGKTSERNTMLIYASILIGCVITLTIFVNSVAKPLMTNLDLISILRINNTNPSTFLASTTELIDKVKAAKSRNSFGNVEVNEQLIQLASRVNNVDQSKLNDEDKANVSAGVAALKGYAETEFEAMIKARPTARNTSFYGSYLRQGGQYEKALTYLKMAHEISPKKQMISFEYIGALYITGKKDEALALAKETYENEKNFTTAKNLYDSIQSLSNATATKQAETIKK
jgi:O-antigen ligase